MYKVWQQDCKGFIYWMDFYRPGVIKHFGWTNSHRSAEVIENKKEVLEIVAYLRARALDRQETFGFVEVE